MIRTTRNLSTPDGAPGFEAFVHKIAREFSRDPGGKRLGERGGFTRTSCYGSLKSDKKLEISWPMPHLSGLTHMIFHRSQSLYDDSYS
jgi:hypothetical protein